MSKGELNDPNRLARDKSLVRPGSWDYEITVDTNTGFGLRNVPHQAVLRKE